MTRFISARNAYHAALKSSKVYALIAGNEDITATNADKDNKASASIATHLATTLGVTNILNKRLPAQTIGAIFEEKTTDFLRETFLHLQALRPGKWEIDRVSTRGGLNIASYDQYSHLQDVNDAAEDNPSLRVLLGEDYIIASDVVIARQPEADEVINAKERLIDATVAARTAMRSANTDKPSLHACVSCKWTMRSDRAQNSRYEALRLIRSRKGRVPHLAVVTAEPLPSRLASIALGTGDIDCVYHIALPELIDAVENLGQSEAASLLSLMVNGRRLKDIADLPLDLAI